MIPEEDRKKLEELLEKYEISYDRFKAFVPSVEWSLEAVLALIDLLQYHRFIETFAEFKKTGRDITEFWERFSEVFDYMKPPNQIVNELRELLGLPRIMEKEVLEELRRSLSTTLKEMEERIGIKELLPILRDVLKERDILPKLMGELEKEIKRLRMHYAGKISAVKRQYEKIIDRLSKEREVLPQTLDRFRVKHRELSKEVDKEEKEVKEIERRVRELERTIREARRREPAIEKYKRELSRITGLPEDTLEEIFRGWFVKEVFARNLVSVMKKYEEKLKQLGALSRKHLIDFLKDIAALGFLTPPETIDKMVSAGIDGAIAEARYWVLKEGLPKFKGISPVTLAEVVTNPELLSRLKEKLPYIVKLAEGLPPTALEELIWYPNTTHFLKVKYVYDPRTRTTRIDYEEITVRGLERELRKLRGEVVEVEKERVREKVEVERPEYWVPPAWQLYLGYLRAGFPADVLSREFTGEKLFEICGIPKGITLEEFKKRYILCTGVEPPQHEIELARKLGYIRD